MMIIPSRPLFAFVRRRIWTVPRWQNIFDQRSDLT